MELLDLQYDNLLKENYDEFSVSKIYTFLPSKKKYQLMLDSSLRILAILFINT